MPNLNGLEGTARVVRAHPHVRVLILSMHADEEHVLQALAAGAAGYLVKDAVPAELELAVRAVARGEAYLSPAVARHVVAARAQGGAATSAQERLTPRLREILQLITEGHTTKEIAHILGTSPKTVENQRARLMQRLGVHDIAGLVRYAIQSSTGR
jgi:DNA-binding NarL/FixJ family response regulator